MKTLKGSTPSEQPAPVDPTRAALAMLIDGHTAADIEEYFSVKLGGGGRKAIDAALALMDRAIAIPVDKRRAWVLEALRGLYRRMVQTGDYAGAVRAVIEFAKVAGVYKGESGGEKESVDALLGAL